MVHLLPVTEFELQSTLAPEEALRRLASAIKPAGAWAKFWGKADGGFYGSVSEERFVIRRNTPRRNSFFPVIYGTVRASPEGSRIHVEMKMRTFVIYFMLVWFNGILFPSAAICAIYFLQGQITLSGCLVLFFMLLFSVALMASGFYPEAAQAKTFLLRIFDAQLSEAA